MDKLMKIFNTTRTIVATTILLISTGSALAGGADLYTSKGCGACHGADAKTPIMPLYPKIAGQAKEYVAQQLTDIKSGARNNGQTAAMKGIMAGVSEEEISAISEYVSSLK
jgi:cytochrome c